MFGRWLNTRLKAAEQALAQGRIDDVLAALASEDLRAHARGQRLADGLVRPLVARARLHRQAGRYREGLADLDRVVALGRADADVQALRQQMLEELRAGTRQAADEQAAARQAVERLEAGRLETARLDVARLDDTQQRERLGGELDARVQRSGQKLAQAAEALDRDDVLAAVRLWHEACERCGRTQETERFAGRLAGALRQAVECWHGEGRVELMLAARTGLEALASCDPALAPAARLVELCARAGAQLGSGDYAELRQTLLRLKAGGEAAWVGTALEAVARITEGREALLASPLGLFTTVAREPAPTLPHPGVELPGAGGGVAIDRGGVGLGRALLALVDGGGSSLLLDSDRVRIGRAGGRAAVEVALPAELDSHHADVLRRGEDYFLTAYGPARVNHQPVRQARLRDGDRIVLGEHARLIFNRPSARSESAVLRLSHRCRLPDDVGAVVLFRDTCLIGPEPSCHIRTRDDSGQAVLFARGERLWARQTAGPGHLAAPAQPVVPGQTLELGGLRLTVKPAAAGEGLV